MDRLASVTVRLLFPLILLAVTACTPAGNPNSSIPAGRALPVETIPPEIADAMKFRRLVGLRSDEAWVRQVTSDPTAMTNYGTPLMPWEEAELGRRAATEEEIVPVARTYGEGHPDEYGGIYIDQPRGGVIVVLFTGNLAEHEAALRRLLRPGAPIEIRPSRFSEKALRALMERVASTDRDLLQGIGIFVVSAGADERNGAVRVELSTERPDAAAILASRYGSAVEVTVVDPTGAFLKPRGIVEGRVVDTRGRPLRAALDPRPLFADIGLDAVGRGTEADGTFRLERWLPGRWRITATGEGYAPASVDVDLPPGGHVTVEIVLGVVGSQAP